MSNTMLENNTAHCDSKTDSRYMKIIDGIEKVCGYIPHPFAFFLILSAIVVVLGAIFGGTEVAIPGEAAPRVVVSVLNSQGIAAFFSNALTNFKNYEVLATMIMLISAVSIGEQCGMFNLMIEKMFRKVPDAAVSYLFMFVAVCSNLISDASLVLLPVIGASLYASRGRNPLIGVTAAFTGYMAGLRANIFPAATVGYIVSATQTALPMLEITKDYPIHLLSDYYFFAVSAILLTIVGGFMTDKVLSPMIECNCPIDDTSILHKKMEVHLDTPEEKRGLRWALATFVLVMAMLLMLIVPAGAPLRDAATGNLLPTSPFIKSIIFILFIIFFTTGIAYGLGSGKIKNTFDIGKFMGAGLTGLVSMFPAFFFVSIFTGLLTQTNLAPLLSTSLANLLTSLKLSGIPAVIILTLIIAVMDFVDGSVFSKWAMLGPVMIPTFALLGFTPAFTQVIYGVGDTLANSINPTRVMVLIVLSYYLQYRKKSGIGTVIAYQIPYFMAFGAVWLLQLIVWMVLDLPLGLGSSIYM